MRPEISSGRLGETGNVIESLFFVLILFLHSHLRCSTQQVTRRSIRAREKFQKIRMGYGRRRTLSSLRLDGSDRRERGNGREGASVTTRPQKS